MRILILGAAGSIAKKHISNLRILGYEDIYCYDKLLNSPFPENLNQFDLAMICTPTETHLEYIHLLNNRDCPYIFCEKPLCSLPTDFQLYQQAGFAPVFKELKSQVYVNNCYRFERGILKLKELCEKGVAGEILHVSMENSYLFEKMHKYPKSEFEGVIYDDIHIINVSRFLWGEPVDVIGKQVDKFFAQWNWRTDKGIMVSHMTDELSPRYKKRIEVKGTKGVLVYNFKAHEIFFAPEDESERIAIPYKHSCHLTESLKYFLGVVEAKGEFKENNIWDALKDVEIAGELCEK